MLHNASHHSPVPEEFLPYHTSGKYKWAELGKKYELEDLKEATEEEIERVKEIYDKA